MLRILFAGTDFQTGEIVNTFDACYIALASSFCLMSSYDRLQRTHQQETLVLDLSQLRNM